MAEIRYLLRGDVDLATADDHAADIQRTVSANHANVLIDCAHVTFIDSTGVRVLVQMQQALESEGRRMLLDSLPRQVRRVFDLLGLHEMYTYERMQDRLTPLHESPDCATSDTSLNLTKDCDLRMERDEIWI